MKLLVIGASQGTGALAVAEALSRGHEVTAFARTPERLSIDHPQLRRVAGSFHDAGAVNDAARGQDAVIITAMPGTLSGFKANPRFFSQGTEHTIAAMRQAKSKRLVVLSALGVGDSRPLMPALIRLVGIDWLLRRPYADHERQEQLVRACDLDWIIARPSKLKDRAATHKYMKTKALERVPISISRADVAHFLVDACERDEWIGSAVQLGG